ncbi:MAG TPA: PAS domain-containing protein, partial [Polyangiales bacterium]|nr:PAS domain-containing protein [Polyangiales bacterium]
MSEDRVRLLTEILDHVSRGVVVWNLDDPADDESLCVLYANRAAEVHTGLSLLDSIGKRVAEIFPTAHEQYAQAIAAVARERKPLHFAQVTRGRSLGKEANFSVVIVPVLERGALALTENLNVSTLNRFLDSIIEHIPAMIFIKDAKHLRFERFNRAGEELLGLTRDKLIGKTDYDFFPKEQADFFVNKDRAVLREKRLEDVVEEPIQTPHGTRWLHTKKIPLLDDAGEPEHLLGISLDITERKRAEEVLRTSHEDLERRITERTAALRKEIDERKRAEQRLARTEDQLRQTQKMEAIGRLAGGIAHDFNNLLSVVLTYSRLLARHFPEGGEARKGLEEIQRAAQRAADLTRQLLAYSRQQVLQSTTFDPNEVITNMRDMLTRLVGEDINLTLDVDANLHKVKSDPNQLEQCIMNLVVNARDAMPTGGVLTIETRNVELDAHYVSEHDDAKVGPHVMIRVSDTGVGMDREIMARIFDPFFTTKEKGKGTGLGLSTVYGIVKQSGGSIWVYSEPGGGSTFKVYLPRTDDAPTVASPAPQATSLRGT